MKPFDPTKPYCRRDGKPAKIVYTFKDGSYLVVYDWRDNEKELSYKVYGDGRRYCENEYKHEGDLVNIPEKIEGWVNITQVFKSKDEADKWVDDLGVYRSACIKVSFTEGEGLADD